MTNVDVTRPSPANGFYSPRAINEHAKPKRSRRTKAAVKNIRDAIVELLTESHPQTVRQVYYAPDGQGPHRQDAEGI
jgi:hypothetical protein